MRQALASEPTPDVFHLHGTWLRAMYYGAVEARRRRVPYLVEPMGMYEEYGLRTKWLRKRVARWWFQDTLLHRAQCLQINSRREGEQLRKLGFRTPLAVVPVGVDVSTRSPSSNGAVRPEWASFPQTRFVLFLSRVHVKKGIELLLRAWGQLAGKFRDTMLVLGGTGSSDYVTQCIQLTEHLGLGDRCVWAGHLNEADKQWAMSHAAIFVLPSLSENLGNVVAEALSHSTPVLTTNTTPWIELPHRHCGWIASPTVESLVDSLEQGLRCSPAELKAMGARGRRWCETEFSLERVLDNLDAVYAWMLGSGPIPGCVITD